jgi:hypothetical protein
MVLATAVLALAVAAPLPAGAIYMLKLFAFQITHWNSSQNKRRINHLDRLTTGLQQKSCGEARWPSAHAAVISSSSASGWED